MQFLRLAQVRTFWKHVSERTACAIVFALLWGAFRIRCHPRILRRTASNLLIATGLVLILYVGGSYFSAYRAQRRLIRQWQRQSTSEPVAAEGPALSRIMIPKIGLDAVIVEGSDRAALALGPGHLLATAWPGEPGNAVIAGHRDTYFRRLYQVTVGDDIYVGRSGKQYHYVVFSKRVVPPNDISVLRNS